jgi:ADP-ribose pyrophosphatase YjhB (NUDIX family)
MLRQVGKPMLPRDLQKPNLLTTECKLHKLVSDVLVLGEGKVLLVCYNGVRKYDGQQGWFLPDDHLIFSEHPLDAARRLLREQLDLTPNKIALSHIESLGGEDGGAWHLIFHHKVNLNKIPSLTLSTNIRSAEWFGLDNLPERQTVAHEGWAIDVIETTLHSLE